MLASGTTFGPAVKPSHIPEQLETPELMRWVMKWRTTRRWAGCEFYTFCPLQEELTLPAPFHQSYSYTSISTKCLFLPSLLWVYSKDQNSNNLLTSRFSLLKWCARSSELRRGQSGPQGAVLRHLIWSQNSECSSLLQTGLEETDLLSRQNRIMVQ